MPCIFIRFNWFIYLWVLRYLTIAYIFHYVHIIWEYIFGLYLGLLYKLWNMFKIVRFDRYMNLKVDLPFMVYSPISFELCKVGQKTFCWKGFDHSERKGPKLKHEWITLIRCNELCAHAIKSSPSIWYIEKHQQVWWILKWIVSVNTGDMT